jgi:integrase
MRPPPTMHALVTAYLAARRSMGFDLRIAGRQLLAFARFADRTGHRGPLTVAVAVRWAQRARRATRLTWARRLQTLRPFMKYRAQFDPGTEIAPPGLFGPFRRRLVPHIYTDAEIVALLDAAAQLPPVTGLRLRPRTYATLFGLLACTGLRISEALALTPIDVDLPCASLTVRQTKFRKSRLVPLHPTAVVALTAYAAARRCRVSDRAIATFFVSDRGTPLKDGIVHHTFERLRVRLGDLRQHAGFQIMPGSAWDGAVRVCNDQFCACQVGIIRLSSPSAALEPGMEETCWISLSKVATRFGAYWREFLARILTRSRSISRHAGTPPRRLAHS